MKKLIFDVILATDDKLSIKLQLSNNAGNINFKQEIRQLDFVDLAVDNNGEPYFNSLERQYKEFADEMGFEFETTAEYETLKKEYLTDYDITLDDNIDKFFKQEEKDSEEFLQN